jgi:hypothetical protein
MARATIKQGETIDFVSPDELRAILGEAASQQNRLSPQTSRPIEGIVLDANGNGTVELYKVPAGMEFALHRIIIDADGITPAAPFTNPAGFAEILRGGAMFGFVSFAPAAGGLPAVNTWGSDNAIRYRNDEVVEVSIVGGPANGTIIIRAQGTLSPLTLS